MINKTKKFLTPFLIIVCSLAAIGAFVILNQEKTQVSPEDLAQKAVDYINENMLSGEVVASFLSVVEENGLYKIHIEIGDQEYDSYITKDGKLLFPEGISLEQETEEQEEIVEPETESSASLEALAKCLDEKGAKFYGTSTCGYCKKQKEMFGEAAQYLPYIECADEKTRHLCEEAEIGPVPTWDFPDGKRVSGLQSFEELIELSGCSL